MDFRLARAILLRVLHWIDARKGHLDEAVDKLKSPELEDLWVLVDFSNEKEKTALDVEGRAYSRADLLKLKSRVELVRLCNKILWDLVASLHQANELLLVNSKVSMRANHLPLVQALQERRPKWWAALGRIK